MKNEESSLLARVCLIGKQWRIALSDHIKSIWPVVALLIVVFTWWYFARDIPLPNERSVEKYGVYGDSFGRITSLFTALGFGGLVITLLLQQRQIRAQEEDAKQNRQSDERGRYEEILFRLLDIYRQTLLEVRVGPIVGRDVLRKSLERVDSAVTEEGVHTMPRDIRGRYDRDLLTENDRARIDYLHFRNFKIVATEIQVQTRLVDTFEVLLEHMILGAPRHLLIDAYRELLFAQVTFLEYRYFFLVALSHPNRGRLRELLAEAGFFGRMSHSEIHQIHRQMYNEHWGGVLEQREMPPSLPISEERIKHALKAHRAAGGVPKKTYEPSWIRQTKVGKNKVSASSTVESS